MLLTPGPTPVPEFVRKAMADITIHHRTPEFEAIFAETRELLFELYGMDEVVMLASSGSGAMEACITNLTHKKALTINSGKFGERFGKICKAFDIEYTEIKNEWNKAVSVEEVINALNQDKDIDAIYIQICESAGGLRHPVEQIANEVKKLNRDIMIVADGLPPGLAVIGLSNAAVEKIEKKPRGFYFNLATEIKQQRKNTTAWTAATTLIIGLREILSHIKNNGGFDALYEKTALRASSSRKALEEIGCKIYPLTPANSMTTVYTEDAPAIRKILKNKYNVNIAGGQDHIKSLIFRINHMGLVDDNEAAWVLNTIELAMDELKIRTFDGTANRVFSANMFKGN